MTLFPNTGPEIGALVNSGSMTEVDLILNPDSGTPASNLEAIVPEALQMASRRDTLGVLSSCTLAQN